MLLLIELPWDGFCTGLLHRPYPPSFHQPRIPYAAYIWSAAETSVWMDRAVAKCNCKEKNHPCSFCFQEHKMAEMEGSQGIFFTVMFLLSLLVIQTHCLLNSCRAAGFSNNFCPESGPRSNAPWTLYIWLRWSKLKPIIPFLSLLLQDISDHITHYRLDRFKKEFCSLSELKFLLI